MKFTFKQLITSNDDPVKRPVMIVHYEDGERPKSFLSIIEDTLKDELQRGETVINSTEGGNKRDAL